MDFTLPELSATNVVTCKCHVNDSSKGRYDIILGRDILIEFGLNLKFFDHIIEADGGLLKGLQQPWLIWLRTNCKF